MAYRDRALAALSRQLGRPSGAFGRIVGRALNRGNRAFVVAAVDGVALAPGSVAVDVGFGGGVGLGLLLDRVGSAGVVHGVEISETMLKQAGRRYRRAVNEGRLQLHDATMDALPLADASVDAVVSTNTIYFVPDLDAAMTELARVLRPGGRLALGVGDPQAMAKMPFTKHGFILRPLAEVFEHLNRAGLAVVDDRRIGDGDDAFHVILAEVSG